MFLPIAIHNKYDLVLTFIDIKRSKSAHARPKAMLHKHQSPIKFCVSRFADYWIGSKQIRCYWILEKYKWKFEIYFNLFSVLYYLIDSAYISRYSTTGLNIYVFIIYLIYL